MKNPAQLDLPQGTLDLLILRVVALGPIHGYAIAQRIQQLSQEALQVQQGSLYPALHRLEYKKFLVAGGSLRRPDVRQSFIASRPREDSSLKMKPRAGLGLPR